MKTYILIYDEFRQFEVILVGYFMKASQGEVITVALEDRIISSFEGFPTQPQKLLSEVRADEVDLFVIPGGDPKMMYNNSVLNTCLKQLHEKGKCIAAICGAPVHLAKAGILDGKRFTTSVFEEYQDDFKKGIFTNEDVVIEGNIITAKPNVYVDFAIEIGKIMDIYDDEADFQETIDFFKYFKDV
jgi:putative intracellular protease/amidase